MKFSAIEPKWLVVIVFLFVGVFAGGLGTFAWLFNDGSVFGLTKIHPRNTNYTYINPLLAIDTTEKKQFLENSILEENVNRIFADAKQKGDIRDASMYFRDLESGRWASIAEDLSFSPGKILRIPLMIAYLQGAQDDPSQLQDKLLYTAPQKDMSGQALQNGTWYTVEDMLNSIFTDPDERAIEILFDHVDQRTLNEIYGDLGINFKENKSDDDFITIKTYALLFRVLYNATYLNRDMSEHALDLLSSTSSANGAMAGLPTDIAVAHTYRRRSIVSRGANMAEVHDCGIIYYPDHPYIMCVMSIGHDSEKIDTLFRQIGLVAYHDMRRTYGLIKK